MVTFSEQLFREKKTFKTAVKLDENYDLIIGGAGISGLAAAHYYRKRFGKDAGAFICRL